MASKGETITTAAPGGSEEVAAALSDRARAAQSEALALTAMQALDEADALCEALLDELWAAHQLIDRIDRFLAGMDDQPPQPRRVTAQLLRIQIVAGWISDRKAGPRRPPWSTTRPISAIGSGARRSRSITLAFGGIA
jgi:hypothetical protein